VAHFPGLSGNGVAKQDLAPLRRHVSNFLSGPWSGSERAAARGSAAYPPVGPSPTVPELTLPAHLEANSGEEVSPARLRCFGTVF